MNAQQSMSVISHEFRILQGTKDRQATIKLKLLSDMPMDADQLKMLMLTFRLKAKAFGYIADRMKKLEKIEAIIEAASDFNNEGSYDLDIDEAYEQIERVIKEEDK